MIWRWGLIAAAIWLASGIYVVQGDQQAVVKRFGRFVATDDSQLQAAPKLVASGLHWDLPWPFSTVQRLKLNEVRSVSLTTDEIPTDALSEVLLSTGPESSGETQFLTGDRNILNVRFTVHFRIAQSHLRTYLTASQTPDTQLKAMVEAAATNLIAQSGVDYVHPLGIGELQIRLTQAVRKSSIALGLDVETVSIDSVNPPLRVKAEFLDVANARADRIRFAEKAKSFAEQKLASADADQRQLIDLAESDRRGQIESARGQASSLNQMLDRIDAASNPGLARRLAMKRLYVEAIEDILASVSKKTFLESDKPMDLLLFSDP